MIREQLPEKKCFLSGIARMGGGGPQTFCQQIQGSPSKIEFWGVSAQPASCSQLNILGGQNFTFLDPFGPIWPLNFLNIPLKTLKMFNLTQFRAQNTANMVKNM